MSDNPPMATLLLIDDDEHLAAPLGQYLARFGFDLISAEEPEHGLDRLHRQPVDLVLLDVMLPHMDGFEVLRRIRRESDVPVIMLTARGEVTDRIVGIELGADDYLPKPFEPRELAVRIQGVLRRTRAGRSDRQTSNGLLRFDGLTIDTQRQRVQVNGRPVELTDMEYRLLALLAEVPGQPLSRDQILNRLKGIDADLYSRAVDILVSRLRHKLQPLQLVKTHRGTGYSLATQAPS